MEKIFIEYVCLSLELVEDDFNWDNLDNINDEEVEAFQLHLLDYIGGFKMFINKLSIPLSENNFKFLYDLATKEIITNIDFKCDYDNKDIIINIYDNSTYFRLNNELKCSNILYNVLGIKGSKGEIIEEYHHLIN